MLKHGQDLRWGRWEYNKIPDDFCRLSIHYTMKEAQQILEEAEKANFLVFIKVIGRLNAPDVSSAKLK